MEIKKNLLLRYRLILQKPFFIKTKITTERKKEVGEDFIHQGQKIGQEDSEKFVGEEEEQQQQQQQQRRLSLDC
jgi:hypothetical protein